MPELLLEAIEYGGYISVVKLIIFVAALFAWLPLIGWVQQDAKSVGTNDILWTGIVFASGAVTSLFWLLMPVYLVGFIIYLLATLGCGLAYVIHRNGQVAEFDRILTISHLMGMFSKKEKAQEEDRTFIFITANNNEVPMPQPKTPEYFGYKATMELLQDALWRRASEVIIAPGAESYSVIYSVDGAPLKQPEKPKDLIENLTVFMKHLADLDVEERRKPQKGKFRIFTQNNNIEWEISTAGSTAGEQIKLKPITKEDIKRLSDIGLTENQYASVKKVFEQEQGVFIISGLKQTGVTTTFYAFLREHDAFLNSIVTLERHISVDLPNITQNVFTLSDTGTTTYAKKLLSIVRMEPDIVGVADCQDPETAQIACKAAKSGKIVYVTLDAENVLQAVGKWIKYVGDKKLVADTLLGITNQRLLRILCDQCKQAYEPNKELLRKFNISPEKANVLYRAGKVVYDKRGKASPCDHCQETGFVGRTSIFEMILADDALKKVLRESKSLSEINAQFRRSKMLYLQEQALKRILAGDTSINEMVRVFSASKTKKQQKTK